MNFLAGFCYVINRQKKFHPPQPLTKETNMRDKIQRGVIFALAALLVIVGLALPSYAKSSGKTKTTKSITGYCYYNSRIYNTSETACEKHHGTFFKDKKAALAYQAAQMPGYCCLDNKVIELKKGDCQKKQGRFFTDKATASSWCDLHQPGWCCKNGKTFHTTRGKCKELKGRFFKEQKSALSWCELHQKGFCLLDGKILAMTKGNCLKKQGRFFRKKAEAQRAVAKARKAKVTKTGKTPSVSLASGGMHAVKVLVLLSIERIYLKDGTVRVQLRNKGKGKLTSKEYKEGILTLAAGKIRRSWPLYRIDPKGNLNHGRTIHFDTGVKPGKQARVQVSMSHVPGNPKKVVLLTPPLGTMLAETHAVKANKAAALKPTSKPMRAPKKPLRVKPTMGGKAPTPASAGRSGVPMQLNRGILISSPNSFYDYYAGETVQIHYRVTNEDPPEGNITFKIMRRGTDTEVGTLIVPANTTGSEETVSLRIQNRITPGRYYVQGELLSGETRLYGESDSFRIHRNEARIDILSPVRGDYVNKNHSLTIRYRLSQRVAPGFLSFELFHDGEGGMSAHTEYNPPSPNAQETERSLTFPLVHRYSEVACGEYTILVKITPPSSSQIIASGISSVFTVVSDWRIGISNLPDLVVGNSCNIVWVLHGDYPDDISADDFLVELMLGTEPIYTFSMREATWHERFGSFSLPWTVPPNFTPRSGPHYRIRITDRRGRTARAESRRFPIVRPSGFSFIWPSEARTYYIGNTYDIRWETNGNARGRQVILKLMRGEVPLMTIATIDADVGRYTWAIPGLCDGTHAITGENLRLRLTAVREGSRPIYHADSAPIELRMPSISFDDWGPGLPRVWHFEDSVTLEWHTTGFERPGAKVILQLLRDGIRVCTIAENIPYDSNTYEWSAGSNYIGNYTSFGTGRYTIRIELQSCRDVFGESPQFTLIRRSR